MKKIISLLLVLSLILSVFLTMFTTTSAISPTEPLITLNKDWTMKQITVSDNNNFTGALSYNRSDNTIMAVASEEGKLGGNMNVYSSGTEKLFTYDKDGTLKDWIDKGGNYRFWIKTPNYNGETIKLMLNFCANINTNNASNTENYYYYKYPSVNSDIEVVADGKWHEVIADFSNNTDDAKADLYALVTATPKSGYTITGDEPKAEKTSFYVRFYNKSTTQEITKTDLQFSHFEFHFLKPTALGDGNHVIPTEPLSTINKYWSMTSIKVQDNYHFTEALNYMRSDDTTMAAAATEGANGGYMNVYSTGNLADKVFTYGSHGTLKEWITTGGNYRFWIKTPNYNGELIKLRLNFSTDINTNDANNTSDYYYKRSDSVNSDIEVEADGEWHEVIADFSSCTDLQKANIYAQVVPTAKNGCSLTGDEPKADKTNFTIRFYNRSTNTEITKSDLQFSHIEFHFSTPIALGNGKFVIPTEPLSTITKYWSMTPITVPDNTNFTDALRYTRTDNTTMAVALSESKIGGDMNVYSTGNLADKVFTYGVDGTLKAWITTGGNYRFWIKTPNYNAETIKLRLNFCADINTNDANNISNYYYKRSDAVNSDIEVTADGKWHEVIANFNSCTDLQKANLYAQALPIAKEGCALKGDEPKADKTNFTIRLYNRDTAREITKSDLQFSHIEFHFSVPTALGDGNTVIPTKPLSTIDKDWTISKFTVSTNSNFKEGLRYNRNDNLIMNPAATEGGIGGNMNVYSSGTDKIFTYDQDGTLKTWINTDGNYRFWIKTPDYNGETIKLMLNFCANINTNNANNTENYYYYKYPSVNSDIEVVADGKWHEVIADFSNNNAAAKADLYALVSPTAKQGYTLTGEEPLAEKTDFYIRFYNKSTKEINKTDLKFSHFEFHFSTPTPLGDGHIDGDDDQYSGSMPPPWKSLPEMSADEENVIFAKTGLDFWTSDWNKPTHSIEAPNMGLNVKDSKYSLFKNYRQIQVTNEEGYYADDNRSDLGFYLTEKTDISGYMKTGTLRFWVNVPKDMTIRVTLLSIAPMETNPSRDSYTRTYVDIPLKKTSENDGYQEVRMPLKDFYNDIAIKNTWNPYAVAYVRIGGISDCTPETFLKKGEILFISHFEFWKAEAKAPEPIDVTRKFYSKNGKFFIRDADEILSTTSIVNAFENSLESNNYSKLVKKYFDNASFLSSYTVEVVSETEFDCYKTVPYDKVEVYFPLSKYTNNSNLKISVINDSGIYDCKYITNSENLIVETDQFGEFLFMNGGKRNSTEFDSAGLANTGSTGLANTGSTGFTNTDSTNFTGSIEYGDSEIIQNTSDNLSDETAKEKTTIKKIYKKYKKKNKAADAPINTTAIILIACSAVVVVGGGTVIFLGLKKKSLKEGMK